MAEMSTATASARRRRAGWTLAVIAWAALFVFSYDVASRHRRPSPSPPQIAAGTPVTAAAPRVTPAKPRILGLAEVPAPPALLGVVTSPAAGSAPAITASPATTTTVPSPATSSTGASTITGG